MDSRDGAACHSLSHFHDCIESLKDSGIWKGDVENDYDVYFMSCEYRNMYTDIRLESRREAY
jgi:hypothetical protein